MQGSYNIDYQKTREYSTKLMKLASQKKGIVTEGTNNHNGGLTAKVNNEINKMICSAKKDDIDTLVAKLIDNTSQLYKTIADAAERTDESVSL